MQKRISLSAILMRLIILILLSATVTAVSPPVVSQSAPLERLQVSERVWMLSGRGGNVGVVVTGEGVIIIDTQYADSAPAIIDEVRAITSLPVRYIINTHVHGDHVGGNAVLQREADIIAHRNTYERMRATGADTDALPRIVFDCGMTLRTGGVEIQLIHQERSHTDTDVAVWLPDENVLITGDLFFNRMTPYVDQQRGAFISGWITFIDTLTRLGDTRTKVVPGHGGLSDMAGFRGMSGYLQTVRRIVREAHAAGRTKEEILALTLEDLGEPYSGWDGGRIGMALSAAYDELISRPAAAQQYEPTWESLDTRPIPAWFNEAKFGIFIHWGVYSVPAYRPLSDGLYASYAEWYYARVLGDLENGGHEFHAANYGEDFEYRDFAPLFRAELFDPDLWADLFRRSGAKYVVLTSKHHDGFSLWPTRSPFKQGWNSGDTGPKRDLVGDLADAVRRAGLRYGLYYSIIEWESSWTHRTDSGYYIDLDLVEKYRIPEDRYVDEHLLPQLRELVTRYQPSLIFSDGGEWDGSEEQWQTKEFLAWLYNEAPNRDEVVVNDRWAKGMPGVHGDYYSSEYADAAVGPGHPWEESRGIGGSYGFNRAENIDDYSSSTDLIRELIDIASRGGNLLLNVGPTADGRIPVIMQQRLLDIGEWLDVNGEAIYGSTAWKREGSSVGSGTGERSGDHFFTAKGDDLYLITTSWPEEDIVVDRIAADDVRSLSLLGATVPVEWSQRSGGIIIRPPVISPADLPCGHAWVIKIQGALRRNAP